MPATFTIVGSGTAGALEAGWTITEQITPIAIGGQSGSTGDLSFAARSTRDSSFLINDTVQFTRSPLGTYTAVIDSVTVDSLRVTASAGSPTTVLAVEKTAGPTTYGTGVLQPVFIRNNVDTIGVFPSNTIFSNGRVNANDVDFDGAGNIYVSGSTRNAFTNQYDEVINVFNRSGSFIRRWGVTGTSTGQFNSIPAIAVDRVNNYIYTYDDAQRKIQKFQFDGTYVTGWGSAGTGTSQFGNSFRGMVVGVSGNIYVLDAGNARVQKFGPTGTFLTSWALQAPAVSSGMSYSKYIAVDSSENVYVATAAVFDTLLGPTLLHNLYKYTSGGTFVNANFIDSDPLNKGGIFGNGSDTFIYGLTVDSANNLSLLSNSINSSNPYIQQINAVSLARESSRLREKVAGSIGNVIAVSPDNYFLLSVGTLSAFYNFGIMLNKNPKLPAVFLYYMTGLGAVSFDYQAAEISTRSNLLNNPSGRRTLTGYAALNGTLGQDPGFDTYAVATGAVAAGNFGFLIQQITIGSGFAPNTTYTYSATLASTGVGTALYATGSVVGSPVSTTVASGTGFVRVYVTFTTTASGSINLWVLNTSTSAVGSVVAFRDALLETGATLNTYFDGTTPPAGFNSIWAGATDNSISRALKFVVYPGWSGNLWEMLNQLSAANNVEISVLSGGSVVVRDTGTLSRQLTLVDAENVPRLAVTARGTGQYVDITWQQATQQANTEVYNARTTDNNASYQVDAATSVTYTVTGNFYPSYLNQPTPVNTSTIAAGQYFVSGADNLPVVASQWLAYGGRVEVNLGTEPNSINITLYGPLQSIPGVPGPYKLAASDGTNDYSTLSITGGGVVTKPQVLHLATGANPTVTTNELAASINIPFINTLSDAYNRGVWASALASGPVATLTFSIPVSQLIGFGLTAGALVPYKNSIYRIVDVQITNTVASITATPYVTSADEIAAWPSATAGTYATFWDGHPCDDATLEPLRVV